MTVIDTPGDCARAPGAGDSLLGALVIAARQRGIHLSQAQLRRDHRIAADGPTPEELLRVARANGLRAHVAQLDFDDLLQLSRALPAIVLLKNGNAMVLRRIEAKLIEAQVVEAEIRRWRMQRPERAVANQLLEAGSLEDAVRTAER